MTAAAGTVTKVVRAGESVVTAVGRTTARFVNQSIVRRAALAVIAHGRFGLGGIQRCAQDERSI